MKTISQNNFTTHRISQISTSTNQRCLGTFWLTWNEMQARHKKGLCYNCDEKFALGYPCKTQHV